MNGHRNRLIEKINETPIEQLDKVDILELILFITNSRKNTRTISRDLLNKFHRITNICQAPNLMETEGIGEFSNSFLRCMFKVCEYMLIEQIESKKLNVDQLVEYLQFKTKEKNNEVFYVVILNIHEEITGVHMVEEGSGSCVNFNIQKLFQIILNKYAHSIILCHNHPGGNPNPSSADITITHNIRNILHKLNICLKDSIIVTNNSYFSFSQSKLI